MVAVTVRPAIGARLGDILVAWGRLTHQQLAKALELHRQSASRLGAILVDLGIVDREVLLAALAAQAGLAYLPDAVLLAREIPKPLLLRVPRKYAEKLGVLPLALHERTLYLATSKPETPAIVDEVRFIAGVARLKFILVNEEALQSATEAAYALSL